MSKKSSGYVFLSYTDDDAGFVIELKAFDGFPFLGGPTPNPLSEEDLKTVVEAVNSFPQVA